MKRVVCTMAILGISSFADAQTARELVLEGNALYETGAYEEASALYERAMETEGDSPEAVYNRACAAYRLGELAKAESLFRDVRAMPGAGDLAGDAAHNLGRSILDGVLSDETAMAEPDRAIERLREAERAFRGALDVTDDPASARNLELTRRAIRRLEQQKEAMEQQGRRQQELGEQLEEMADEQQRQSQQNRQQQQSPEQGQQNQESLSAQTQEAQQQAQQMAQEASSPEQQHNAQGASDALEQAAQAQRRAEEALERGDQQSAAEAQREASEKLREAAGQLSGEQSQPESGEEQQQSEQDQSDQQEEGQEGRQGQQQTQPEGEQPDQPPSETQQAQQAQQGEAGEEMTELQELIAELLEKEERDREARRAMRQAPGTRPVEKGLVIMQRRITTLLTVLMGVLALGSTALAQSDAVRVRAVATPESAYVGQPVRLSIEVQGTTDATQPVIDAVEGLDIRYSGAQDRSSSFTSIINGRRTERRTEAYVFQWLVRASEAGTYTIPSIEVTAGGVNYTTDPVRLRFEEPPTTEEMLLDVTLERDSAYVGEPVKVTIDWYFARNPENWRFALPGAGEAFDLVSPETTSGRNGDPLRFRFMGREVTAHQARTRVDGMNYARVRIEQMLIPRQSGTIDLNGASVSADLVMREGFFDNETRYVIARAGDASLEARPLPSEGRSRSFSGLIGRYRIEARASETDVRVGDPIEITLSVDGPLVESVNPPALHLQRDLTRDFRVPEDLGLSEIEGGRKVWRFTIRPTNADVSAIPSFELPYFDTDSGAYETASTEPIPLSVSATRRVTLSEPGAAAPSGVELEESDAGIAHNYAGDDLLVDQRFSIASALTSPSTIALTAGPVGFWAASAVFVGVRKRRATRPRDEKRRAAGLARRELEESTDPGAVSRAVYAYIGRRLDRSPAGLTPESCAEALSERGDRLATEARELLESCDDAAYAPSSETDVGALRERAARFIEDAERAWRVRS